MQKLDITHKTLSVLALEAKPAQQAEYIHMLCQEGIRAEQMLFLDETSVDDRTFNRRVGYAPRGERARSRGYFIRGLRYSSVAALHQSGLVATQTVEGSFDREKFAEFVRKKLVSVTECVPGGAVQRVFREIAFLVFRS